MIHFKKKTFIVCKTPEELTRFIKEAGKQGFSARFDMAKELTHFEHLNLRCLEIDADKKCYLSGFTYEMLKDSGYKEIFEIQKDLDRAPFQVTLPTVGWVFRGTESECKKFVNKCLVDPNYNRANADKMKIVSTT